MIEENKEQLREAVKSQYNCSAHLVEAVPVTESFNGETVWEGTVHVFDITRHPQATRAYAWSSPIERSEKRRFFAVLQMPPVKSARNAVRSVIMAEHRSEKS